MSSLTDYDAPRRGANTCGLGPSFPNSTHGKQAWVFVPMPRKLKRYCGHGHFHLITCSCYRRLPLLGRARARNEFVRRLGEVRAKYDFKVVG